LAFIGGVDEAGRGPLAGPVVAAVVVLASDQQLDGVRDSKKLSAARRQELVDLIQKSSIAWSLGQASVAEIDQLNILGATMLAMQRAVAGLSRQPQLIRVDGNRCPDFSAYFSGPVETLVGGDDICPAIGAASILAKVARDSMMDDLHTQYPQYGFDRHRGYPTAQHREALQSLGPMPEHRTSFRPVREALAAMKARAAGKKRAIT
jgi:ribonuclease HII